MIASESICLCILHLTSSFYLSVIIAQMYPSSLKETCVRLRYNMSNSSANSGSIHVELTAEFNALRPLVPEAYHVYLGVFSKRKETMLKSEEKGKPSLDSD